MPHDSNPRRNGAHPAGSPGLPAVVVCAALGFAGIAGRALPGARPPRGPREEAPVVRVYPSARSVAGRELHAYVFPPPAGSPAPRPALLFFHPGGWVSGAPEWTFDLARRFSRLGVVSVAVEYRLSGETATPIDALEDTCAAFRWVRRNAASLGIDPHRVGGYGISAGGQLAAAAAGPGCGNAGGAGNAGDGEAGPDLLLLWSPMLDVAKNDFFQELLRGHGSPADFSPAQHMPAHPVPADIVAGEVDSLSLLPDVRGYCAAVTANGGRCDLQVFPGVGHLLTRNLAEQETNHPDVDPAVRETALRGQERFLCEIWRLSCPG
jgi:acetyl esterase